MWMCATTTYPSSPILNKLQLSYLLVLADWLWRASALGSLSYHDTICSEVWSLPVRTGSAVRFLVRSFLTWATGSGALASFGSCLIYWYGIAYLYIVSETLKFGKKRAQQLPGYHIFSPVQLYLLVMKNLWLVKSVRCVFNTNDFNCYWVWACSWYSGKNSRATYSHA